jgi:hypothetical protein
MTRHHDDIPWPVAFYAPDGSPHIGRPARTGPKRSHSKRSKRGSHFEAWHVHALVVFGSRDNGEAIESSA